MTLGELAARIGLDVGPFMDGFDQVNAKLKTVASDATKSFAGFDALGSKLTSAGMTLTAGLTLPIVGAGAAATKMFSDFEGSLNRISALGGITGRDLDKLKAQSIDLGAKTQFSAQQAADGMAVFAGASFNATQIAAAMPGTLNLAAAGQMAVGAAATLTSDILGQFGLAAADSSRVADVLAKAGSDAKASLGDMGLTLSYVGVPAKQLGLTLEETTAAIVLVDQAGIRAEKAGTGLRGVFASLVSPSKEAAKEMQSLGIHISDAQGKILPFADIMEQFRGKLAGVTGEAEKQRIVYEIFGREAGNVASVLIDKGGPALDAFEAKLMKAGGAAASQAQILNQGLGGAMERMRGSIETAGIALGDILAPSIIKIANLVEAGANKLSEFGTWFKTLPVPIQNAAVGMAAFAAALGPLLLGAGAVASSIASVGTALAMFKASTLVATLAATGWTTATVLLAPALVAIGVAVAGIQLTGLARDLSDLTKEIGDATGWWGKANDEIEKTPAKLKDVSEATKDVKKDVFDMSKTWESFTDHMDRISWTNLLTGPLGAARDAVNKLREAISMLTGTYPTMERAGSDALNKLATANNTHARSAAEAAMKVHDAQRATGAMATAHDTAVASVSKHTAAQESHRAKLSQAEQAAVRAQRASEEMFARYDADAKAMVTQLEKLDAVTAKLAKTSTDLATDFKVAHERMQKATLDAVAIIIPEQERIPKIVRDTVKANEELGEAYKRLGVTSSETLRKQAEQATLDYGTIKASGKSSARDIEIAWVAMEKATIAAAIAAGQEITKEQRDRLAAMEASLGTSTTKQKSQWGDFSREVSTIITNLAQDIGKSLWDGDMSWGEKGKKVLKDIGAAFTASFIQPATQALTGFLTGVVADLMGGRGFGGMLDQISKLGSAMSGVFGGSNGIIFNNQGQPGSPIPSGGGSRPGGGSTPGGGSLTTDLVTGGISAGLQFWENLQNIQLEKGINAIEMSTRYTKIATVDGPWSIQQNTGFTREYVVYINTALAQIRDIAGTSLHHTALAQVDIGWSLKKLDEITMHTLGAFTVLQEIRDSLRGSDGGVVVQVTATGVTTQNARTFGQAIGGNLRLQGVPA